MDDKIAYEYIDAEMNEKYKQEDNEFDQLVKNLKVESRVNFLTALKPPEKIQVPKTFFVS